MILEKNHNVVVTFVSILVFILIIGIICLPLLFTSKINYVKAITLNAPTSPVNLKVNFDKSTKIILLSWDPPENNVGSDIILYNIIKFYENEEPNIDNLIIVDSDTKSYSFEVEESNKTYCFVVYASNGEDGEKASACIYIPLDDTPPPPTPEPPGENPPPEQPPGDEPEPTVPKAPCYLYGQYDPTLNEVLMHWNKPTNDGGLPITEYRIYRFSKGIIELIGVLNSNLDQISFVDKNLLPGTYQYYVTAVNTKGESQPSNSLIIETF